LVLDLGVTDGDSVLPFPDAVLELNGALGCEARDGRVAATAEPAKGGTAFDSPFDTAADRIWDGFWCCGAAIGFWNLKKFTWFAHALCGQRRHTRRREEN
jgi:hypothetical protein